MQSKLFAFRVAQPVEAAADTPLEFTYDPQSQTAIWSGSGTAIASLYCTIEKKKNYSSGCNGYANYCTTWGGAGYKKCD